MLLLKQVPTHMANALRTVTSLPTLPTRILRSRAQANMRCLQPRSSIRWIGACYTLSWHFPPAGFPSFPSQSRTKCVQRFKRNQELDGQVPQVTTGYPCRLHASASKQRDPEKLKVPFATVCLPKLLLARQIRKKI